MLIIPTERLDLIPLSGAQLRMCLEQPDKLEQELGFPISRAIVTERVQRAITMKLARMVNIEPARQIWYTYWLLVIRAAQFGAGLAGFKGYPNRNGEVEIGYGIDPVHQGLGYTTEAVGRMIAWAFEESTCMAVIAQDTKKWNLASQRVLAKAGMKVYDEYGDGLWMRIDRPKIQRS